MVPVIQEELQISRSQIVELKQVYQETISARNRLDRDLGRLGKNEPLSELAETEIRALYENDKIRGCPVSC
jgi:hypothetical protein